MATMKLKEDQGEGVSLIRSINMTGSNEQVSETSQLPVNDILPERGGEGVEALGDVFSCVLLEERDDLGRHKLGLGSRIDLEAVGSSEVGRAADVVGKVVDVIVVDGDGLALARRVLDLLREHTEEAETEVVSHVDHLLVVPVRSGVVCEGSEVVVDGVGVERGGTVDGVDLDPGRDGTGGAVAEGADLGSDAGVRPPLAVVGNEVDEDKTKELT
jgi:hypothetical protein